MTKDLKNGFRNFEKTYKQKCPQTSTVHVLPELCNDGREQ